MKIQAAEILKTFLTFGFYGYVKTKRSVEQYGLKKRIVLSELILGFLLVVPVLTTFFFVSELWLGVIEAFELTDRYTEFLEQEEYVSHAPLVEVLYLFPDSFFFFLMFHSYLAVAFIQHSSLKDWHQIWKILLFGFFALDWKPLEHLETQESESDGNG